MPTVNFLSAVSLRRCFLLLSLSLLPFLICAQSFPDAWTGRYTGLMTVENAGQPALKIAVSLTIETLEADSLWTHRMVYYASKQYPEITKDYLLRAAVRGDTINYELDEQNGIVMELTYLGDCFYGMYTVLGTTYITTLRRLPDGQLLWDLFAAPESSRRESETEMGPPEDRQPVRVEGLKPSLHQTVFLRKFG